MANGKFVIKMTASGEFKFNLQSANGQIIATSESYSSKANCENGIESVRRNCGVHIEDQTAAVFETLTNPKYEVYKDKAGEFRFRLKARNGEIIASGEGYSAKAGCLNGINSIKENAPNAPVEEKI